MHETIYQGMMLARHLLDLNKILNAFACDAGIAYSGNYLSVSIGRSWENTVLNAIVGLHCI